MKKHYIYYCLLTVFLFCSKSWSQNTGQTDPPTNDTKSFEYKELKNKDTYSTRKQPLCINQDNNGSIKIKVSASPAEAAQLKKYWTDKNFFKSNGKPLALANIDTSYSSNIFTYTIKSINDIDDISKSNDFFFIKEAADTVAVIAFKNCEAPPPPKTSPADGYLQAIKCRYPSFVENQAFKEGKINYIFTYIDANKKIFKVPGTEFPDCNSRSDIYRMVFLTTDSVKFKPVVVAEENLVGSDLVGNIGGRSTGAQGSGKQAQKGPCDTIQLVHSQLIGPYDLGVDITISIQGNNAIKPYTVSIPACNVPYHFSVIGGFYASTLNSPDNITAATVNTVPTLIADNATSQKALTVMAVFYPNPRDRYYQYKELNFWEKWSICFGTKLSQNLFDDLLLGLNYEFAKGGSFAGGVHYGQHRVIAGYKNFKFGKDYYDVPFDLNQTRQRWDFGIFVGVNIDFRIITFIRDGADGASRNPRTTTASSGS